MACWVTENAPVMTACEAITVAAVASSTIGSRAQRGHEQEERAGDVALGCSSTSAPWPM